jgi:hypothetical protein
MSLLEVSMQKILFSSEEEENRPEPERGPTGTPRNDLLYVTTSPDSLVAMQQQGSPTGWASRTVKFEDLEQVTRPRNILGASSRVAHWIV